MAEPVARFKADIGDRSIFASLKNLHSKFQSDSLPDLPTFQGGLAGFFSYDIGRSIEHIPAPKFDDLQMPAAHFCVYDVVLAIDHFENRAWIVSQGWDSDGNASRETAQQRMNYFRDFIDSEQSATSSQPVATPTELQAPSVLSLIHISEPTRPY